MGVVEEWESGGGQGDVPPGMGEPGLERDSESKIIPKCALRPEVRRFLPFS